MQGTPPTGAQPQERCCLYALRQPEIPALAPLPPLGRGRNPGKAARGTAMPAPPPSPYLSAALHGPHRQRRGPPPASWPGAGGPMRYGADQDGDAMNMADGRPCRPRPCPCPFLHSMPGPALVSPLEAATPPTQRRWQGLPYSLCRVWVRNGGRLFRRDRHGCPRLDGWGWLRPPAPATTRHVTREGPRIGPGWMAMRRSTLARRVPRWRCGVR